MPELPFTLYLNSPAFVGSVRRGKKTVEQVKKPHGQPVIESSEADYYPADPGGIRVPGLRGVLEFWFRALLGNRPSPEVYREQGRIFGSTAAGQGLSIRPAGRPSFESGELRFSDDLQPFLYLGYGPLQFLKVPRKSGSPAPSAPVVTSHHAFGCRDAILLGEDGSRPGFAFVARGTRSQLEALKRALVLLHLFGGVGARSRRGWGSVEVAADFMPSPSPKYTVDQWLQLLLQVAFGESWSSPRERPRHSAFGTGCRLVRTSFLIEDEKRQFRGDYRDVLKEFYDRFAYTRLYRPPNGIARSAIAQEDHDLEQRDASAHAGSISGVPKRLAFGLPYHPQSHGGHWDIEYAGMKAKNGGQPPELVATRRSSPLFLKVFRIGPGTHMGLALLLDAQFFGDPGLRVGAAHKNATQPQPTDYEAIHEFLDPQRAQLPHDHRPWKEVPLPGRQETSS